MRLYLPATLDELDPRERAEVGVLAPRRAHGVTSALRAALPDEDEESLEFAALLAAADDALVLLAGRPDAPRLRLVMSIDVPEHAVGTHADDDAPSALELMTEVTTADLVCAHVDEPSAASDVHAALRGDTDAIERLGERDLLWYDASELDAIPR